MRQQQLEASKKNTSKENDNTNKNSLNYFKKKKKKHEKLRLNSEETVINFSRKNMQPEASKLDMKFAIMPMKISAVDY